MAKHRAPFVSLWSRDDVRAAVVDFLPTKAVAAVPEIAKPISAAQTPLLITAIRRRGKTTIPSPQTRRALLDALFVGETQYFCENWEGGLEHWEEEAPQDYTVYFSQWSAQSGRYLRLTRDNVTAENENNAFYDDWGNHVGFTRRIHGENLLVTRFRLTMSYEECRDGGAVGYVMLCGPPGSDIIGPRFDFDYDYDSDGEETNPRVNLVWMGGVSLGAGSGAPPDINLVEEVSPQTSYAIDARFRHDVASAVGRVDFSVNGRLVMEGQPFRCEVLKKLQLYNFSRGTSHIGPIEIWYEKAAPNQVWHSGY